MTCPTVPCLGGRVLLTLSSSASGASTAPACAPALPEAKPGAPACSPASHVAGQDVGRAAGPRASAHQSGGAAGGARASSQMQDLNRSFQKAPKDPSRRLRSARLCLAKPTFGRLSTGRGHRNVPEVTRAESRRHKPLRCSGRSGADGKERSLVDVLTAAVCQAAGHRRQRTWGQATPASHGNTCAGDTVSAPPRHVRVLTLVPSEGAERCGSQTASGTVVTVRHGEFPVCATGTVRCKFQPLTSPRQPEVTAHSSVFNLMRF